MVIKINGLFSSPRSITCEEMVSEGDQYFVRHSKNRWRVYEFIDGLWSILGIVVTRQEMVILETLAADVV